MDTSRFVRTSSRTCAAGLGLAAAAYAAYAAATWLRYGNPQPPRRPEEQDALLDRFMPTYEVVERHQVRVAAPADVTLTSAAETNLDDSSIIRAIFRTRALVLRSRGEAAPVRRGLRAEVTALGWGVLAETAGREIVFGAVTRPWDADVVFRAIPPDAFAAFKEPGYAKIAWTLRADPVDDRTAIFRTETRVATTDADARAKFRRYWSLVNPGVVVIRRLMLKPVKAEAERRAANVGDGQVPARPRAGGPKRDYVTIS